MEKPRAREIVALALLAVLGLAGLATADADYTFSKADWGVDFVHAGDRTENATYAEVMGSGACVLDYDQDGWQDLLLVNSRYDDAARQDAIDPRTHLYRNDDGAGFTRVDALNVSAWGQGCAAGDVDADGDPDVAINTWGGPLLFQNHGDGTFTNVTDAANVTNTHCGDVRCFGASIAFFDYDGDDDLDLYATNYVDWPGQGEPSPILYDGQCNVLYENDGTGTFSTATSQAGLADCGNNHLGLAIRDFDGDALQDVYVASDETPNALYLNNRNGTFADVRDEAGVADTRGGMGTDGGDFDGDGNPDIVITHFGPERYALYLQADDGTYTDEADVTGLADYSDETTGWGTEFLDYDNDGDQDLLLANGHVDQELAEDTPYGQDNRLLENTGGRFENVTADVWQPEPVRNVTRGLAYADFDQDGALDVVTVNNANESAEVYTSSGGPNNWLQLDLEANATIPPDALGTKVTVHTDEATRSLEVEAQSSYESQSTRTLHVGLGEATTADTVIVDWPDGTQQTFTDVQANQRFKLEANGTLESVRSRVLASAPDAITANRTASVEITGQALQAEGSTNLTWTTENTTQGGNTLTHQYDTLGTKTATFAVEDATGATDEATTRVHVENLVPTARIDAPDSALSGTNVTLDASNSTDPDTNVTGWTWAVENTTLEGESVDHAFPTPGTVEIELTVTDSDGGQATTRTTITIENRAPTAKAGPDKLGNKRSTFTFDGTDSTDPDGEATSYAWDFGDGTNATGATVNHSYDAHGNYTATLTVTDDAGATATDTLEVTVNEHNAPPVPRPGEDRTGDRTAPVVFDGSASSDPDGEITRYEWDLGDGTNATGPIVNHTYDETGTFHARLTVHDDTNGTANATVNVTIQNLAPSVDAGEDVQREGLPTLNFSANASDPDGEITSYAWDFDDGTTATGSNVTHAWSDHGRYTVTVTATDAEGGQASDTIDVWLYARPRLDMPSQREANRVDPVRLDASHATDSDGEVVEWRWELGDGTHARGPVVEHTYEQLDTFTASVTAIDDDGFATTRTIDVHVSNLAPEISLRAPEVANLNQSLTLDATDSLDRDGLIDTYRWQTSDGQRYAGEQAEHAFTTTGTHAVQLTAIDDDNARSTLDHAIHVTDELAVTADTDQATYPPNASPGATVQVGYANAAPVPQAPVEALVQYVAHVPAPWGPPAQTELAEPLPAVPDSVILYQYRVEGETDGDGRFTFEVPPLHDRPTPLHTPTGAGSTQWGHYRIVAGVDHQGNHGNATTAYQVHAPTTADPPIEPEPTDVLPVQARTAPWTIPPSPAALR